MTRPPTILLAESDRHDEELIMLALESANLDAGVIVMRDGEAVVDFFLRVQKPASRRRPNRIDLLLLELALPKLDGLKVLRQLHWLFREDVSQLPPIVVMAACTEAAVVAQAYRYGANGFLGKSAAAPRFVETIQQTLQYWLCTTVRPSFECGDEGRTECAVRSAVKSESSQPLPSAIADLLAGLARNPFGSTRLRPVGLSDFRARDRE